MKVKDLTKQDNMDGKEAHTLVKDLLSKSFSKSGKVKALKLKVKFGGDSKKPKRHSRRGPAV